MAAAEISLSYTGMGGGAKPRSILLGPIDLSVVHRTDTVRMRSAPLQIKAPAPGQRACTYHALPLIPCLAAVPAPLNCALPLAFETLALALALALALHNLAIRLANPPHMGLSATRVVPHEFWITSFCARRWCKACSCPSNWWRC
jgi:hypothetical protein